MQSVTVLCTFGNIVETGYCRLSYMLIQHNGYHIFNSFLFILSLVFEEKQYYNVFKTETININFNLKHLPASTYDVTHYWMYVCAIYLSLPLRKDDKSDQQLLNAENDCATAIASQRCCCLPTVFVPHTSWFLVLVIDYSLMSWRRAAGAATASERPATTASG